MHGDAPSALQVHPFVLSVGVLLSLCYGLRLQYGNGTLRLTTRQCYQLHGVLKGDLKTVFSSVIKNMGSTLVRL